MNRMDTALRRALPLLAAVLLATLASLSTPARLIAQEASTPVPAAAGQPQHEMGGEANLVIPDLSTVQFFGMSGHRLLMFGLIVCALGLLFGLVIYSRLKNMAEGLATSASPSSRISKIPISLVEPNRFLAPRRIRNDW